jgi:hypothetical protein
MILKMLATCFVLFILCGIGVLALMPTPDVRDLRLLPDELGMWFDTHDFERNTLGGIVLQLGSLVAFAAWRVGSTPIRLVGISSISSLLAFSLAEMVQLALPMRNFDWMDIGAALIGISAVNLAFLVIAIPIWIGMQMRAFRS